MITAQEYIDSVVEQLARGSRMREQIAQELHGIIGERLAAGSGAWRHPPPAGRSGEKLAESYLAAVPMESAGLARGSGRSSSTSSCR